MIQLDKREAFPFSSNPFGLVYENAITENKENEVQIHPITYQLNGIKIASNIYTPKNYSKDKRYPAIVIAVPNGAVKEQAAGLYGQRLAEKGYITIVSDCMFFGESEGMPRQQDIPYYRIEDIRGMIDVIFSFPGVDSQRIYGLGICGGGGYLLSCGQMDKRLKKIATVSMFNMGAVRREGFQNSQVDTVLKRLHEVASIREKELNEDTLIYNANMTEMKPEVGHQLPIEMYREGYEYYVETHFHPNSHSCFLQRNLMDLMVYDPVQFMYLLDQPLLMMVGDHADTNYMSEQAFELAITTKEKELYYLKDATHIQTYYKESVVKEAIEKLLEYVEPMEKKESWMEQIEGWKEEHPLRMKPKGDQMQAQDILETINEVFKEDDKIVVTDVGQHQMFTSQYLEVNEKTRLYMSGGLGTM